MKKTLIAAITLLTLTTGATFAQRVYSAPFDNRPPQYGSSRYNNDQAQDELKIDRLDALVGLSRRQEKQLRKIENNYDSQMAGARLSSNGYRQIMLRKRQDMLAVLTSAQRDRLFASRQNNRYNRSQPVPYGRRG